MRSYNTRAVRTTINYVFVKYYDIIRPCRSTYYMLCTQQANDDDKYTYNTSYIVISRGVSLSFVMLYITLSSDRIVYAGTYITQ